MGVRLLLTLALLGGALHSFTGSTSTGVSDAIDPAEQTAEFAARPDRAETTAAETIRADLDADERSVLAFLRGRHTGMARHDEENVARAVVEEARRHDFDPALVLAVIQVESGGYNLAVSHVGAAGLMQLLPTTAEELADRLELDWRGPDSLFDPVLNVKLGTAYLRQLTNRYGDVTTALAAYNWGPGRIDQRIRRGSDLPSI